MKTRRVIAGVLALVGIVLAAAGAFHWSRTGTPDYAFARIATAAKNRDLNTFREYVDVEGVSSRLFDDLIAYREALEGRSSDAEKLGNLLATGLARMMKSTFTDAFQVQIERLVEEGRFENLVFGANASTSESATGFFGSLSAQVGASSETFVGAQPWEHEGKTASIGLKFHHAFYDDDFVVELKFRELGHWWQLAELSNISGLLDRLRELEERHSAELELQRQEKERRERERKQEEERREREEERQEQERREAAIAAIRKQLSETITMEVVEKRSGPSQIDSGQLLFDIRVTNLSSQQIAEYDAHIWVRGRKGVLVKLLVLKSRDWLQPGQVREQTWMRGIDNISDYEISILKNSQLQFDAVILRVLLADGSELVLTEQFTRVRADKVGVLEPHQD